MDEGNNLQRPAAVSAAAAAAAEPSCPVSVTVNSAQLYCGAHWPLAGALASARDTEQGTNMTFELHPWKSI